MFTVPVPGGEVIVRDVAVSLDRLVPATVPNVTAVAPLRLVPVTVTTVPPAAGPEAGEMLVIVGALFVVVDVVHVFCVSGIHGIRTYPAVLGETRFKSLVIELKWSPFMVAAWGSLVPYSTSKTALLLLVNGVSSEYSSYSYACSSRSQSKNGSRVAA